MPSRLESIFGLRLNESQMIIRGDDDKKEVLTKPSIRIVQSAMLNEKSDKAVQGPIRR